MFQSFSILLLFVALFSVFNYKVLKLPTAIGLMVTGILTALVLTLSKYVSEDFYTFFCQLIIDARFEELLFDSLLSFLLFAGSLHVDYGLLKKQKKFVTSFATVSVLISTIIIGTMLYYLVGMFGISVDFIYCLLFGALISPTDPVAALAILKKSGVSQSIKMKIEGESLFNDGVGVIVYSGILIWFRSLASAHAEELGGEIFMLFLEEVGGGLLFGAALGFVGYYLIKLCSDNSELQVILSIAIAAAGYSIAVLLHTSGPLAMVVAGLIIGNRLHLNDSQSEGTKFFNRFWEVIDETLNGILFLMLGLTLHLLNFESIYVIIAVIVILVVLFARFLSVLLPYSILKDKSKKEKGILALLTWGGLRGGISLGLAMSLPENEAKDLFIAITFIVVAFSIIAQGLTIGILAKKTQT
ncbi:MAG: CPA1 family monovalent cation:H+ antiporter [Arenicella sp.]|jgi:CPA1 family monovalent cation:H+ antiporter